MKKINFISLLDIEKKELGILVDRAIELKDMVKQNIVLDMRLIDSKNM